MRRTLVLAALFAALAPAAAAAPSPRVLHVADSGKTVRIAKGQELRVALTECASCGYRWVTKLRPNAVVLTRLPQVYGGRSCEEPCAGGTRVSTFRWRGRTRGVTMLRLSYVPPGQTEPTKAFKLTVRVR